MRDIWARSVENSGNGTARIDVLSWLSRATLDVIGLAGFNYKFNALNEHGEVNELNKAFSTLFHADGRFHVLQLLQAFFPIFRIVVSLSVLECLFPLMYISVALET